MAKVWTDEEVQAEIKAAVAIWASDHDKAEYERLKGKYEQQTGGEGGEKTPPKKENEGENKGEQSGQTQNKKKGIWWGEVEDE